MSKARAVPAGSTGVTLTWANSPAAHFARTVIRLSTGTAAPQSPSGGKPAAVVTKAKHAVTIAHLKPATHYRFALFATDGHGHYARRAVAATTTAPGTVRNLRSYADRSAVVLTWSAPTTTYADVVVRYAEGTTAPAHPWLGHRVPLTGKRATSATLAHLSPDTEYTARVWSRNSGKHPSTPVTTRFFTPAKPAADGTVTGRVTDTAGHPLEHVAVWLYSFDPSFASFGTSTRGDGTFSKTVPPGSYFVGIYGDAATGGRTDATGYLSRGTDTTVSSEHSGSIGTIRLGAGGALTGRVTDTNGQALAGVDATLATPPAYVATTRNGTGMGSPVAGATTAADGTFTIKGVPSDAVLACYDGGGAHLAGTAASTSYDDQCAGDTVSVAAGTTRSLADAHLTAAAAEGGAGFTGHITGPDGKPVANADLTFTRRGQDFEDGDAFTADDGSYSAVGLTPGTYRICVDTSDVDAARSTTGLAGRCTAHAITLAAGHVVTVDFALTTAAAISGTVTDHRGHRLAGVEVYFKVNANEDDFVGETDNRGQYVVKNLAAGTFRVCFDPAAATVAGKPANAARSCAKGGAKIATRSGTVRTGVDARLPAGGSVRGRVTDGNGHAVPDVAVVVTPDDDDGDFFEGNDIITGADGRYSVTGLTAGKYSVCFEAFGFETTVLDAGPDTADRCTNRSASVTVDHATAVDIDLPVSAAMDVTVHDGDGHPVAGVNAVPLHSCNADITNCSSEPLFAKGKAVTVGGTYDTDGDGLGELYGLAPGNYAVCLFAYYGATTTDTPATGYADTCSGSTYNITVAKGQTAHVSLTLGIGGTVSGTVTDTAGHPVRGATVRVAGSAAADYKNGYPDFGEGPQLHAMTGVDGTYSVRSVRSGTRAVCVDASAAQGESAGGYLDQCLGSAAGSTSNGTSVTVTAGGTTGTGNVQLTAAGAISGHVTLSGKVGADVQYLIMRPDGSWVDDGSDGTDGITTTDADGNYKHMRLPPATYVVCFYQDGYASQCYKNVSWDEQNLPAQAARLDVRPGQLVSGVNAAMHKRVF